MMFDLSKTAVQMETKFECTICSLKCLRWDIKLLFMEHAGNNLLTNTKNRSHFGTCSHAPETIRLVSKKTRFIKRRKLLPRAGIAMLGLSPCPSRWKKGCQGGGA